MIEKQNLQNSAIFTVHDLWRPTVDLRSNLRTNPRKICKRAIECFFRALLTFIVHELRRHLSGNVGLSGTTVKSDLW